MKRRIAAICLLVLTVFTISCNLAEDGHNAAKIASNSPEVLNDPPFEDLTDSIRKFPDQASLYFKRGQLLSQHELHQLAFHDYRKAWNAEPNEIAALAYVSNLFVTGKEKEAVALLEECVKTYPHNTDFQRRLSEAYLQSGKAEKALEQYNSILLKDPANFEAWYEKGLLLAQSNDTANAIAAIEKAYSLQPLQSYGTYLAQLYAETKNPKALALCDALLQKDSLAELTDALFLKGIYYSNINKHAEALEQFDSCIRRDWKFTEAYIEKGIILYNDKNIDEALKTFALAAKVSNTYADTYYWMGRCFESIGKTDDARANYYKALALDRNFPEAHEALNRLKNAAPAD